MIPDLLQHHNLKSILLYKFQTYNFDYTDNCGCNYLVSVKDVMYSERKLKIKGLLGSFSSSKGVLTVSDFIASFSDIKTNKQDSSFIKHSSFIKYFLHCDMDTEIKDVSELLMVIGFVAKGTITHLTCITCKSKQGYVGKLWMDNQEESLPGLGIGMTIDDFQIAGIRHYVTESLMIAVRYSIALGPRFFR